MIIAMLLGAGAIVAGASKGTSGSGLSDAGAAAVAAPGEMIGAACCPTSASRRKTPTAPA